MDTSLYLTGKDGNHAYAIPRISGIAMTYIVHVNINECGVNG